MHQTISYKFFLLLIAGLLLFSCTKPGSTLKDSGFVGTYTLMSVNGNPVPANIFHESTKIQVHSGTFTIDADGTCSTKTVFIPPSGVEMSREVSATYVKDGSKLTMQWKGAGSTVGTIQGSIFSMDNEGMLFVYKK